MLTSNFKHNFHKKKKVFCIKARSTSALHSHEGKDTKPTTVKWSITKQGVQEHNLCYLWIDERRPLHNIIASNTLHYIFALVVKDSREVRCVRVWSFFSFCLSGYGMLEADVAFTSSKGTRQLIFFFQFRGYSIILPFLMKRNFVKVWQPAIVVFCAIASEIFWDGHACVNKKTAFHNTGAFISHIGLGQSVWHFQAIYSYIFRAKKL